MEIKVDAIYKKGVLIPKDPINLEENTSVQIIVKDKLYNVFSIAGEEDNVGDYFDAQKEVINND